MAFMDTIKNLTNVQMMKYKTANQKGQITKLRNDMQKLQALVRDDILSLVESTTTYKGNAYQSYSSAVAEIVKKYNGTADWGVLQTGNIIDLRAAFIIGEGLTISEKEDGAEKEVEWAEKFLEFNDLDAEVIQEFAKEAEIEGKIALKLALEEDKEAEKAEDKYKVSVRFISWADKKYEIITAPQDYLRYEKLTWKPTGDKKAETLEAKEFIYKKFGGRIQNPNEAAPKIMKCLTQIDNLDKALRDWREINRIYAGPILYMKCADGNGVKAALEAFDQKNFKLKKFLAGTGDLQYIGLNIAGVESLENEIKTLAKMISGTTGTPIHFLGLVELMSNRSTAENLMEMISAATSKERETWIGTYAEVIRKAMTMYNDAAYKGMSKGKQLNPDKIRVEIPIITKEHYARLEKIFLPACVAGKLSDEAFLEMIPGLDVKAEMERKEAKENSELDELRADKMEQDLQGGGPMNIPQKTAPAPEQ